MSENNGIPELDKALDAYLKAHDKRLITDTLADVCDLIDLIMLDDARKLEFRKLSPVGKIQMEASILTCNRIKKYLISAVVDIDKEEKDDK